LASEQRKEGENAWDSALGLYHVLENEDWQKRPTLTYLDVQDQQQLKENIGELLFVRARSVLNGRKDTPREQLAQALRWNEVALTCFPRESEPGVFLEQRANLARRLELSDMEAE